MYWIVFFGYFTLKDKQDRVIRVLIFLNLLLIHVHVVIAYFMNPEFCIQIRYIQLRCPLSFNLNSACPYYYLNSESGVY